MPLTQDQEEREHGLRVDLMDTQIKHFKTQIEWEPWKAMAIAAGAGAALMGAVIGLVTMILRGAGKTG